MPAKPLTEAETEWHKTPFSSEEPLKKLPGLSERNNTSQGVLSCGDNVVFLFGSFHLSLEEVSAEDGPALTCSVQLELGMKGN